MNDHLQNLNRWILINLNPKSMNHKFPKAKNQNSKALKKCNRLNQKSQNVSKQSDINEKEMESFKLV